MSADTLPLGCAQCEVPRRRHDDPTHRYEVPSMSTVLARAAEMKTRRAAA